jgi:hypothetical protein
MLLFLLYIPYLFTLTISPTSPKELFWTCWFGHFAIYALSFSGILTPLPKDRPFFKQFFRPFIYTQLIYTTYTGVSSIFYFVDSLGYFFFTKTAVEVSTADLYMIANIEQYQLLAHTTLAHGLLITTKKYPNNPSEFYYNNSIIEKDFYKVVTVVIIVFVILSNTGAFSGIATKLATILTNLFLLSFARGLEIGKKIIVSGIVLLLVVTLAATSGMKEGIATIGIFFILYFFPKKPILTTIFALIGGYYFFDFYIPLTVYIRKYSWYGQSSAFEVVELYWTEYTQNLLVDKDKLQWSFLTQRLNLIGTSIKYFEYVPTIREFFGWNLIDNMLMSIIPAGLRWDNLTIDGTAMARAIECGAVEKFIVDGGTSVKPTFFEDSYILGGASTIAICHLLWGYLANLMGVWCEKLFGGYEIGCIVMYLGACGQFNGVPCFENAFSSTFYSFVLIIVLFYTFKQFNFLEKTNKIS